MNTLFMQNCDTKVDEVNSTGPIYQNLEIPGFSVLSVWVITSHQHTDIIARSKTNNTGKIFISNIEYLKLLRIY